MTVTPVNLATTVDLKTDRAVAVAWARLRDAQRRLEEAQAEVELYRGRFDEIIGDREQITADGRAVAFYRHDGRFSVKRFTEDMPHIASQYMRERVETSLDEAALKADHPYLYTQYRARTLRPAKGSK
jgi:plasmid stabilization system protein ParE